MATCKNVDTKLDMIKRTAVITETLAACDHVTVFSLIVGGDTSYVKVRHAGFKPTEHVIQVCRRAGYRLSFYDFINKAHAYFEWDSSITPTEVAIDYLNRMDLFLEGNDWWR